MPSTLPHVSLGLVDLLRFHSLLHSYWKPVGHRHLWDKCTSRPFSRISSYFNMSQPVIVPAKETHTATIIFLHGLGDSGHGWASTIASIVPSYVKVICPTAPVQPVTLNGGYAMPSWFDLITLDANGKEDAKGIAKAGESIQKMLDDEQSKSGIRSNRIILGGFSQGGGLALHSALRYPKPLAGILALSCWLPLHKDYPGVLNSANKDIHLLQCHGEADHIVPVKWGEMSSNIIKQLSSKSDFKKYRGLAHSSNDEELQDMKAFIKTCLPAE